VEAARLKSMTTDEFERILVALASMRVLNINGENMVPLHSVVRVVHSNLNGDDRGLYEFDFQANRWMKKSPGGSVE
jgi:hypothetical protein